MSATAPQPASSIDATGESWAWFMELWEVQRRRLLALGRELDLSPPQLWVLRHLEPGEPRQMGEFAPLLVCESSNVTGVTDRLESRGLVERQPAPHDRRVRMLALTKAGVSVRKTIVSRMLEPVGGFDVLNQREQAQLARLLTKVGRSVIEADGLSKPLFHS